MGHSLEERAIKLKTNIIHTLASSYPGDLCHVSAFQEYVALLSHGVDYIRACTRSSLDIHSNSASWQVRS